MKVIQKWSGEFLHFIRQWGASFGFFLNSRRDTIKPGWFDPKQPLQTANQLRPWSYSGEGCLVIVARHPLATYFPRNSAAAPVSLVSTDWACLIKSELTVWGGTQTWRERRWIDLAHQVNAAKCQQEVWSGLIQYEALTVATRQEASRLAGEVIQWFSSSNATIIQTWVKFCLVKPEALILHSSKGIWENF